MSPKKSDGTLGVFAGVVAVGKESYRCVVLRTRGEEILEAKDYSSAPEGVPLHHALADLNLAVQRVVRDNPAALWMDNPALNPKVKL